MKKGLIIFMGESFRLGGQGNINIGSDESVVAQIDASKSHMIFVEYLEKKYSIDIIIGTYITEHLPKIIDIYKNNLLDTSIHLDRLGTKNLLTQCLNKISNVDTYDFILLSRIDICYKKEFTSVFKDDWKTIRFASICFKPHHKLGHLPRVNPMLIFIPKKYFNYISTYIDISCHGIWYNLIQYTDLKVEDLDTMLSTYHDSDSFKDFNPIYYIVNRPQSEIWHTRGELFDKFNF